VAQDCIVTEFDCGTSQGITMGAVVDGGDIVEPLSQRILGRNTAEDGQGSGPRARFWRRPTPISMKSCPWRFEASGVSPSRCVRR
jgi:hypothetical protein